MITRGEMTVAEFLAWDAPGAGRWQLIDGVPEAMASAGSTHGILQSAIDVPIRNHLMAGDSPFVVMTNPGVVPAFRAARNYFVPDAAVTCVPSDIGVAAVREPMLGVEILSPSDHAETWRNVPDYMLIPSVREMLVIHVDRVGVELLARRPDQSWPEDMTVVTEGDFALGCIELNLGLGELYRRSGVG